MSLDLEADIKRVTRKLESLARVEVPRAYASATNKVMAKIKTQLVKELAPQLGVKAKLIRSRVFVKRATAKKLRGAVTVYHSDIPGIAVKPNLKRSARNNARGRRASNKIKIGKQTFSPAFVNTYGKGGKLQVLYRTSKARYPIKMASVPLRDAVEKRAVPLAKKLMGSEFQRIVFADLKFREGKRVT